MILAVAAHLVACAVPTPGSFRPRGVDVYVEGGRGRYAGDRGTDLRAGVSVHFDLEYADEWEEIPEEQPE